MTYRLTRRAEEDVIDIYVHGALTFGLNQADTYHRKLEETFQLIAAFPQIARERSEIDPPVRVHPFNVHIIVYTIAKDGDLLIIRVRHGHEDWLSNPSGSKTEG